MYCSESALQASETRICPNITSLFATPSELTRGPDPVVADRSGSRLTSPARKATFRPALRLAGPSARPSQSP